MKVELRILHKKKDHPERRKMGMSYFYWPKMSLTAAWASFTLAAVVTLLFLGCAHLDLRRAPGRTDLETGQCVVKFSWNAGTPMVEVMLDSRGPYHFLVDTGVEGTSVSQECARELRLETRQRSGRHGYGGGTTTRTTMIAHISEIRLGTACFMDVPATVEDLSAFGCDGIIGFPVFADLLLTIDGPQQEIRLSRGQLPSPETDPSCLPLEEAVSPQVMGRIANERIRFKIDTGFQGTLFLPNSFQNKPYFNLSSPPQKEVRTVLGVTKVDVGHVTGPIEIGAIRLEQTPAIVGMMWPVLLGGDLTRHWVISFDQRNKRARFLASP